MTSKLLLGRRQALVAGISMPAILSRAARASDWPDRPIRMIVGYAPGGGTDVTARIAADAMAIRLRQPIVVENRSGGGGVVAANGLVQSPADANTLMVITPGLQQLIALGTPMPFDPANAWQPVGMVATGPVVLVVNSKTPVTNLRELQEHARKSTGGLQFGSPSVGVTVQYFAQELDIMIEEIRYRGTADVVNDLLAGRIDAYAIGLAGIQSHIESGAFRPIAIASDHRSPALPNLLTTVEQGFPTLLTSNYVGLVVRTGTPEDRAARLHAALNDSLADPAIRKRLVDSGLEVEPSATPAAFGNLLRDDKTKWEAVVRKGNLRD
jgi:tripartite-type tricarboxylate transporter receptor subunit TctC